MTLEEFTKKKSKIPEMPGVYFFLDSRKKILYIGKAAVLRDRLRSYFSSDLQDGRGERIVQMVARAKSIDWRETDSVLEALILESNLIKTHKPSYNIISKDDKSFNYVAITEEDFPRIVLIRGKELAQWSKEYGVRSKGKNPSLKNLFGPFPHGMQLKIALKIIRRIFPYRDTCTPCDVPTHTPYSMPRTPKCRPCFNRQIGLCPGVCTGEISKEAYARTIHHLTLFFQGKKQQLLRELQKEMKKAAKEERFEEAGTYKRQLFALQHIQDVALIKDEYRSPWNHLEARPPDRIEAYDIAHLRGEAAYGVMAVVENNEPMKDAYRLFKIRTAKTDDDPGALREILSRRLAHSEWPMPQLIVVDGAAAQMNAAAKVLAQAGLTIPIVGVVKDEKHRPREIRTGINASKELIGTYERSIILANAEAHRFAIARHRKTLRTSLTKK